VIATNLEKMGITPNSSKHFTKPPIQNFQKKHLVVLQNNNGLFRKSNNNLLCFHLIQNPDRNHFFQIIKK
jgi:hypothetical protein